MSEHALDKIEAIYDLREAVEEKVRAEVALQAEPTPEARDILLEATLLVEEKTQDAIEICHQCSEPHASDMPHQHDKRQNEAYDNVIEVDFRKPESE